jgi:hypothetical protein
MAIGSTGTVLIAAAIAGAAGAGAAVLAGTLAGPAPVVAGGADPRVAALESRLEEQAEKLHALQASLDEVRSARFVGPGGPSRGPGPGRAFGAPPDGAAGDPMIAGSLSSGAPPGTPEEAESRRAEMEKVYQEQRQREQEESRKTRAAAEEAQTRSRLDRLAGGAALTESQKDAVVAILTQRREKMQALYAEARAAGGTQDGFRAMQEPLGRLREETTAALSAILSPEQMKAVEPLVGGGSSRRPEGGGAAGAGRRPGGRRPGAGGGARPAGEGGEGAAPETPK